MSEIEIFYRRCLYHPTEEAKIFGNREEFIKALGECWQDHPWSEAELATLKKPETTLMGIPVSGIPAEPKRRGRPPKA